MKLSRTVLQKIASRRKMALDRADDNLDCALKNKDFKQKYLEIKSLKFEKAQKEYEGQNTKEIVAKLEMTTKEAEKILAKMSFKFSDFEPEFYCEKCQDKGIINGRPCVCYFEELSRENATNFGGNFDRTHTFEEARFDIFDNSEEYEKNFDKLKGWCKKVDDSQYKNLLLCGKTGVGKTFLTECLLNEFIRQSKSVVFFSSFALDNLFLKYHTTFDSSKDGMLDGILNCDVLAIDDLGSEPIYKNVTAEYLFLVVGERLLNNKTTIVSTNLTFDEIIDRYGERTFSRLCNKRNTIILKLENSDLRRKREV